MVDWKPCIHYRRSRRRPFSGHAAQTPLCKRHAGWTLNWKTWAQVLKSYMLSDKLLSLSGFSFPTCKMRGLDHRSPQFCAYLCFPLNDPRFKSQRHHLPPNWSWAGASLLICKMATCAFRVELNEVLNDHEVRSREPALEAGASFLPPSFQLKAPGYPSFFFTRLWAPWRWEQCLILVDSAPSKGLGRVSH